MPALRCLYVSQPEGILTLLDQAFARAFGPNLVGLEEVDQQSARVESRLADDSADIVAFVAPVRLSSMVAPSDKVVLVEDGPSSNLTSLVEFFSSSFGTDISDLVSAPEPSPAPTAPSSTETLQPSPSTAQPEGTSSVSSDPLRASYEAKLAQLQHELDLYKSRLEDAVLSVPSPTVPSVSPDTSRLSDELASAKGTITDLQTLLATAKSEKSQLSDRNLELAQKVVDLEKQVSSFNSSSGHDLELKHQISRLESSPFNALRHASGPSTNPSIALDLVPHESFNSILPVFAANGSSIRSMYRVVSHMAEELSEQSKKVMILDLCTETCLDYVFQFDSIRSSYPWLFDNLSLEDSITHLRPAEGTRGAIDALSPGLEFFNDSSILNVSWTTKLKTLRDEGYSIILVGGSLSTLIPRVLYNNFTFTQPWVVVEGALLPLRALLVLVLTWFPKVPYVVIRNYSIHAQSLYQNLCSAVSHVIIDNDKVRLLP